MTVDWQLVAVGAANIVSVAGAYYGLKADNLKLAASQEASNARQTSDLKIAILNETAARTEGIALAKRDMFTLVNTIDDCVKDLSHRIVALEQGQNEWTKVLRDRTHELAEKLQGVSLKVDRLERPHGSPS